MSHNALRKITAEAKRIQKRHPRASYQSALKQAGKHYRSGKLGKRKRVGSYKIVERGETKSKKPAATYQVRRTAKGRFKGMKRVGKHKVKKSKPSSRKHPSATQVVKVVRVTRVGKVHHKRRRMAGSGSGLKKFMPFVLLAGAGLLLWHFLKPKKAVVPPGAPPLVQTNNQLRNQQSNEILQYAMAASLGIDSIIKLISQLNRKSDAEIESIHENVDQGGGLPDSLFV